LANGAVVTVVPACTRRNNFASVDILFRSASAGDFQGFVRGVAFLHDAKSTSALPRVDFDVQPELTPEAVRECTMLFT
jgi:penicillin-binding protein-related factor A (putative recombinase)